MSNRSSIRGRHATPHDLQFGSKLTTSNVFSQGAPLISRLGGGHVDEHAFNDSNLLLKRETGSTNTFRSAMAARNILRRALLYVPGSSQRFLDKSRTLTADCVTYDLEDSVTPGRKAEARTLVRAELDKPIPDTIKERIVRINSVGSGLALDDLSELLKSPNLTTIMLPKTESHSDLTFLSDVIAHARPSEHKSPLSILALIESAKSLSSLSSICAATPSLLSGLIFAAEDFALDLSLTRTPDLTEFLYARSMIATAARAHNLPSTIDLVCTAFKSESDQELLLNECRNGKRMGFNGKQCIHPSQVGTVSKVFSPEHEEVEWAVRIVVAQKRAEEQGKGAWAMDGKMIDAPVEGKARAVVEKARLCGFDVDSIMEKHKDQQPE